MIYTDMADVPRKKYGLIYADPAWSFLTYSKTRVVPQRAKKQHYDVMTREELQALPVGDLAAKDCVLVMWITASNLLEGLELAKSWGFTYKTKVITWCKMTKRDEVGQFSFYPPEISPRMGLGHWSRQESEDAYLFTKGKPKRVSKAVRQLIFEPRREHSRKPDCTRGRLVALVGDVPRIELFSRTEIDGWDQWGNEADKFKNILLPESF